MRSTIATAVLAILAACGSDPSSGDDTGDDVDSGIDPDCGNGALDEGEACDDGNDDRFDGCLPTCEEVEPLDAEPLTWTYLEIPGTQCIDGTPSGFSVNLNPESPNLYVYLEGGGACFNAYCESLFVWSGDTPGASGVFQRDNVDNPVGDWNMVYVPYCSGDVYGGRAETELAGETRHFYGYTNMTAFLERWVPWFDAEQVVFSGSSAGGFGASVNYPQVQDAFGDTPVTLINDSAPPLTSEVFPPCLQGIFREVWGLDETLLADCGADCDDPDDFVADYLAHVRDTYPGTRGGVFSSLGDNTIRLFAGYGWSEGWNTCGDLPSQVSTAVYTEGLEELRVRLTDGGAGFGTYYVPGTGHTILRGNGFYSTSIGGTSPADWVGATIDGASSHVGPESPD